MPHTKSTATQSEVAVSYDRLRELYILAVIFAATIISTVNVRNYVNALMHVSCYNIS